MRILIVDDSKAMRMIVRRTLRQAGFDGHDVVEAESGKQAADIISASCPDLILSDWNMPEMSGVEILGWLNDKGLKPKFGFVTSEGTQEMLQRAQAGGALFVLTKPFTTEAFQGALKDVIH
jgi:two-component system chemotaxis response regulator CheY